MPPTVLSNGPADPPAAGHPLHPRTPSRGYVAATRLLAHCRTCYFSVVPYRPTPKTNSEARVSDRSDRMVVLQRYLLAIGEHDAELRALAAEAAHICGAPVALLGFLGTDRETIKAAIGWNVDELPLMSSFAAHLADARDVVVIPD